MSLVWRAFSLSDLKNVKHLSLSLLLVGIESFKRNKKFCTTTCTSFRLYPSPPFYFLRCSLCLRISVSASFLNFQPPISSSDWGESLPGTLWLLIHDLDIIRFHLCSNSICWKKVAALKHSHFDGNALWSAGTLNAIIFFHLYITLGTLRALRTFT